MGRFSFVRGDIKAVVLPANTADVIEVGDILWWDNNSSAVRPASQVSGSTYADKKSNLAANFIGIALESKDAGKAGSVLVATAGDFLITAPSGTGTAMTVGQIVAGGNGTTMANQVVSAAASTAEAIGVAAAPKSTAETQVLVRILSRLCDLGMQVNVGNIAFADGGGLVFGTRTIRRSGNNIIVSLPTSNPGVSGALWVDAGVVKVVP